MTPPADRLARVAAACEAAGRSPQWTAAALSIFVAPFGRLKAAGFSAVEATEIIQDALRGDLAAIDRIALAGSLAPPP
jgi:hypothetical protein